MLLSREVTIREGEACVHNLIEECRTRLDYMQGVSEVLRQTSKRIKIKS